jgi:adenosylcobinamide-GDP ribazoletransferase
MAALIHEARLFFIALQFFTRVPVPAWVGYTPEWMHASARHYPLVGACVGGAGALVLLIAAQVWPLSVAVGLSMAATVWLTGGFHEDGLADTCDGLGGSVGRERALTIMKDSRLGSYGVLGLVGVLGLKAVALQGLAGFDAAQAALALVWAHVVSRAVPVALLRLLPYAGDAEHAKAKPMAQQVSGGGLAAALGWAALACAAARGLGAAAFTLAGAALGVIALAAFCVRWYRQRLGGYTGDTLGAAQQLTELAGLLGWLAALAVGQGGAGLG